MTARLSPYKAGAWERSGAQFSECSTYRYHLWRNLQPCVPGACDWPQCAVSGIPACQYEVHPHLNSRTCLFVMLNPSTADHATNDPTVERCQRRASSWGFSRLEVCNLFALRSTDPKALYAHPDPVGEENDTVIARAAQAADLVICAWGQHGMLKGRGRDVEMMLRHHCGKPIRLHYLKLGGNEQPYHPLYLPYSMKPTLWA